MLLEHFLIKHQRQREKVLKLLISEDLVSLFIGKQGKNIKHLMDKCHTTITLKREANEGDYRPVEIIGNVSSISAAVREIDQSVEIYWKK